MASRRPYNLTLIPGPISASTNSNGQKTFVTRASLFVRGRPVERMVVIPDRIHGQIADQLCEGREITLRCLIETGPAEDSTSDRQVLTVVAAPRTAVVTEAETITARALKDVPHFAGLPSVNSATNLPQLLLLLS